MPKIKHIHPASETGRSSLRDIVAAIKKKGAVPKHKLTRKLPDINVDPDAVKAFMATHESPPAATPGKDPLSSPMSALTDMDELTEEDIFIAHRRKMREEMRRKAEEG